MFRSRFTGRVNLRPENQLILHHAELDEADFSNRELVQISVQGSRLTDCRFDKVRVESASFGAGKQVSRYIDCTFDGSRIKFGPGGYARFERCSFRDTDLRNWFCFSVELIDCTFSGRLRRSVFNGTVSEERRSRAGRDRNEFRGNDFSAMDLVDVGFRTGIDLSLQRLPSGDPYLYLTDASAAVQRAREAVIRWEDLSQRQKAMNFIGTLEDTLSGGQNQLLLRKSNYSHLPKELIDSIFVLLAE
jgi:uncharacterized protein YjbI with pentapeptide repeats